MELFVCVKSVPTSDTINFDAETGNLRRAGNAAALNPADMVTVEAGLRFVEEYGGRLGAVSMGPVSAETGLRSALSMGVHEAHLLCDQLFAGADTLATAYTLAAFFRSLPHYDIVFCGKHSTDGDTGQTGAMLAELLNIPHACGVCAPVSVKDSHVIARQRLDTEWLTVSLPLPCLLIVENDAFYPRDTTLAGILRAKRQEIHWEDMYSIPNIEPCRCGGQGSPTRVKKMFMPKHSRQGQILSLNDLSLLKSVLLKEGGPMHG